MTDRYFDDFQVGDRFVSRGITVTESGIVDFAMRYDPQPFHIDVVAAKESNYGGLIASGFHTLTLGFRMVLETGVFRACSMGSPGFDELRWLRPVRPGTTLHTEFEIVEKTPSRSKPDRGIMRVKFCIKNEAGEDVITFTSMHLTKRKV
ncbi:MAG TPA: MaoC family dehydratase [Stellaceae bacterium]|nr:MaoC family dehydratase [Stellaceae bacterium]